MVCEDCGFYSLTPESYNYHKRRGLRDVQIGEHFGVTKQAVNNMKRRYADRILLSPREQVKKWFPWEMNKQDGKHSWSYIRHQLGNHAEYMASGGNGMSPYKIRKLIGFYSTAKDFAATYTPDRGWYWVPRMPEDAEMLVRPNKYCRENMTSKMWAIWNFPEEIPVQEWGSGANDGGG